MISRKNRDIVIRLREYRRRSGLSQKEAARLSGIGVKTISSFESGARTETMKIGQLRKLLEVYGLSEVDFFTRDVEPPSPDEKIMHSLLDLPDPIRQALLERIEVMVSTAQSICAVEHAIPFRTAANEDWSMLNSHN